MEFYQEPPLLKNTFIHDKILTSYLKNKAFKNLTSRDPKQFWTSGQWMTERTGDSNVSETSSLNDFGWKLNRVKWFTLATTLQMAMPLARPEPAESGSRDLSLFCTETKNSSSSPNDIEILRLKDKLGTRTMPKFFRSGKA